MTTNRFSATEILLITVLILTSLSLLYAHVYAQSNIYEDRHTIDFPNVSTNQSINLSSEELRKLLSMLKDAMNTTSSCEDIECVRKEASSNILNISSKLYKENLLSSDEFGALSLLSDSNVSSQDLYSLISDPEIRRLINSLNTSDLENFKNLFSQTYSRLNELYASGRISLKEYAAALELLRRISLEKNDLGNASMISSREADLLRKIIEGKYTDLVLQELSRLSSNQFSSSSNPTTPSGLGSASSSESLSKGFSAPQIPRAYMLSIALPRLSLEELFAISLIASVLVVFVLVAVFWRDRLLTIISRIGSPIASPKNILGNASTPVRLYWLAVSILSKRIPRSDSDTHREYLAKIREKFREIESFSKLTSIYEINRFGGVSNEVIEREAVESFERLREDVKKK